MTIERKNDGYQEKLIVGEAIKFFVKRLGDASEYIKAPVSSVQAAGMLDNLFTHMSGFYPPDVKKFLHQLYFDRKHTLYEAGLYESGVTSPRVMALGSKFGSSKGSTAFFYYGSNSTFPPASNMGMVIDTEISKGLEDHDGSKSDLTPVILRLISFHEILIHAGLKATCMQSIPMDYMENRSEKAVGEIMAGHEMIAAITDKVLIDLVPTEIIQQEAKELKGQLGKELPKVLLLLKLLPMQMAANLMHRGEDGAHLTNDFRNLTKDFAKSYINKPGPAIDDIMRD